MADGAPPPSPAQAAAGSTKAALQALRALQSKIGRLEKERSSALVEASELRLQFEISSASSAQEREVASQKLEDVQRSHAFRERELEREADDLRRRLEAADVQRTALADECAGLRARCDELARQLSVATAKLDNALDARDGELRRVAALEGDGEDQSALCAALEERLALTSARVVQLELRNESLDSALELSLRNGGDADTAALARAARTQAKSPAAPRARKVPRRVAARAAAAAAAPPPPQRKPASAEKPQKKAPPFSSSASRALVDAPPPPPPDASKRPARAAKQPLVPRVASLGVRPGAAGVPPRAKTPPPPPRRAPPAARTPPARPALMPPPPTSGGAARRVVVRDVRRAKVGANGGAKKPPPKKAPKLLEAGDPGALAAALSDAIQAADDPHHVRTLCEILARVKSS